MNRKSKVFVPVMLTPFHENGSVDYDALTKLTEFYLEAGAGGLFANCQSSEMFFLSDKERLAITRHVVNVAAGAVPVVAAGTFEGTVEQQADFVKEMYDTGIAAVITITGTIAAESESEDVFNERFDKLLNLTPGIPLGFYECPHPYKRLLSLNQISRFVDTGRIIYYKDTCLDINTVRSRLQVTQTAPAFGLYDAYMVNAVESLKAGAAGLSCIQGNYFPELVVWLCDNYDDASKAEDVARVQQFFISNMEVMHAVYPVVAKYFLHRRGLTISSYTRVPAGTFSNEVRTRIDSLYNDYIRLSDEIALVPVA